VRRPQPGSATALIWPLGARRDCRNGRGLAAHVLTRHHDVDAVSPELARALTGMSLVQSGQGHYQDAIATAEEGRRAGPG
jgi:hypothetical protein